jgi:hypothetical protein
MALKIVRLGCRGRRFEKRLSVGVVMSYADKVVDEALRLFRQLSEMME